MLARLILAGEFLCGGESDVSFRQRGVPFAAPAVSDEDVTWGLYALAHHDIYDWLGLTFRFALGPDGRVRGATVVELTEETYTWVKPLLDRDFTRQFVGQPASARFVAPESGLNEMPRFYGQVIASLVQRAAVLFDVAVLQRGEAA